MNDTEWETAVYRPADAYCAATTEEDRARIAGEFYDRTVLPVNATSSDASGLEPLS